MQAVTGRPELCGECALTLFGGLPVIPDGDEREKWMLFSLQPENVKGKDNIIASYQQPMARPAEEDPVEHSHSLTYHLLTVVQFQQPRSQRETLAAVVIELQEAVEELQREGSTNTCLKGHSDSDLPISKQVRCMELFI